MTSGSGVTEKTLAASDWQTLTPIQPEAAAITTSPDVILQPLASVTVKLYVPATMPVLLAVLLVPGISDQS